MPVKPQAPQKPKKDPGGDEPGPKSRFEKALNTIKDNPKMTAAGILSAGAIPLIANQWGKSLDSLKEAYKKNPIEAAKDYEAMRKDILDGKHDIKPTGDPNVDRCIDIVNGTMKFLAMTHIGTGLAFIDKATSPKWLASQLGHEIKKARQASEIKENESKTLDEAEATSDLSDDPSDRENLENSGDKPDIAVDGPSGESSKPPDKPLPTPPTDSSSGTDGATGSDGDAEAQADLDVDSPSGDPPGVADGATTQDGGIEFEVAETAKGNLDDAHAVSAQDSVDLTSAQQGADVAASTPEPTPSLENKDDLELDSPRPQANP